MKKLQLPSSYAALSPEEQCVAFGGSEFGDAVGSFFDNLHFNDFFWNGGLISFSFTFVPMLLFRVIKTGVQTGIKLSQQIGRLLGITREATVTAVQYLDSTQQRNDQPVENSLPQLFSLQ
ncbi:hypothetical protein RX476_06085 [Faecalibacterium prausnitzii]|uniref:hypothetical protein n=1 Tax=Faecalibacterium prausnitzii TaxID=853 RepID=UPI002907BAB4|nr:hypothetical protein [Faecalibacterium prausnitzii]MDU8724365.1 hypothetical protein [Faecalibacterium prausnitzii]